MASAGPEPLPEAQAPVSPVGRVVGTFVSPTATFQSIAARPGFLLPLLLSMAVSLAVGLTLAPKIDYDQVVRSSLEKRGTTLPDERVQAIVEQQKKIGKVTTTVLPFVAPVVISLLVTLVFWGVFKAFGWDFTFKQGFGVTTHALLPGVLGALGMLLVLRGKETVDPRYLGDLFHSNLGFLVDPSNAAVHSLAQSIDLFSFWTMFLMTIGYSSAAKTSRGSAAGVVIGVWVLYVLGKTGLAALIPH